jgi:serine/threonine-protein kinase RsbW
MTGTRRTFAKSFSSLGDVFEFLEESLSGAGLDERAHLVLQLAVEELFTNMVKYNSGSSREIGIMVDSTDDRVQVQLIDPDADPFDPSAVGPVDTSQPIEQRRRGGLGLHLVRSLVDAIDFCHEGREMKVSVTTRLE